MVSFGRVKDLPFYHGLSKTRCYDVDTLPFACAPPTNAHKNMRTNTIAPRRQTQVAQNSGNVAAQDATTGAAGPIAVYRDAEDVATVPDGDDLQVLTVKP